MSIGDRVRFKHWIDGKETTGVIVYLYELSRELYAGVRVNEDVYYSVRVSRLEKVN